MDDATYEAQKARWMALSEKWKPGLGLGAWEVTYHWRREPLDRRPFDERGDVPATVCQTNEGRPSHVWSQWAYMAGDVEVDLRLIEDMSDERLELLYLHEMGHLLLSGLRSQRESRKGFRIQEERMATELAHIFIGLNQAEAADPDAAEESA